MPKITMLFLFALLLRSLSFIWAHIKIDNSEVGTFISSTPLSLSCFA
jgi:hypothetical protein